MDSYMPLDSSSHSELSAAVRPGEFVELRMDSAFPEGKGTSKEAGAHCATSHLYTTLSV